MQILRVIVERFSLSFGMLCTGLVCAQTFPSKPIRILTSPPGGNPDFTSRIIAQRLTESLGQQVIVDNRVGIVAVEAVSKAPPDGYTLLLYGNPLWLTPLLRKTSYDPVRDFSPITLAVTAPTILVVHPSLPVKTVKDLIVLAKARPAELNYASAATGSVNHLGAELFKAMAGVNLVRINYKGAGPVATALIAGEVQLTFATTGSVAHHLKSGKLRGLAVTSLSRSKLAPDLPTVASTIPGYESVTLNCIFAPSGTPTALLNRLNQEIVRVLNREDVKEKFLNSGAEVVGSSSEQLALMVKSDLAKWGKLIADAGIRED